MLDLLKLNITYLVLEHENNRSILTLIHYHKNKAIASLDWLYLCDLHLNDSRLHVKQIKINTV